MIIKHAQYSQISCGKEYNFIGQNTIPEVYCFNLNFKLN